MHQDAGFAPNFEWKTARTIEIADYTTYEISRLVWLWHRAQSEKQVKYSKIEIWLVKLKKMNRPIEYAWVFNTRKKIGQLKVRHRHDKTFKRRICVMAHKIKRTTTTIKKMAAKLKKESLFVANQISQHKTRWFNRN